MKPKINTSLRFICSFCLLLLTLLPACTYMKSAAVQEEYRQAQEIDPGQYNLKHIIDGDTFTVYGLILDDSDKNGGQALSVAAYSDRFKPHELVDVTHFASVGTHYVLNLPEGIYDLLVLADSNENAILEVSEVVGRKQVEFKQDGSDTRVLTDIDIKLSENSSADWPVDIDLPAVPLIRNSLVFPQGALRGLDDPIFGEELSTLGMYEPAAFRERAPMQFYSLEEYIPYKVPVIFVHGIGGSAREFLPIVKQMDREKYVPWFFYYPSGEDLNLLAENFYSLYLSGRLLPRVASRMIVVAHSMGGLIVREAFNLHYGSESENQVALFISIASPFGGHPDAAEGIDHAPMVLRSWRNLDPEGQFIEQLFRKPLPASLPHQLLYAYSNPDTLKLGENSDGVVPLSSQLRPAAQTGSQRNMGFNNNHTGVLQDSAFIEYITTLFQSVTAPYSQSHVLAMQEGGYDVDLDGSYGTQERYLITVLGKYLAALSDGKLQAVAPFEKHFVEAVHGKTEATAIVEKTWLRFTEEYPNVVGTQ